MEFRAVAVTELPSVFRRFKAYLGQPAGIHLAVGFHPLAVARSAQRERVIFSENLPMCDFVGEIGLDYSRGSSERIKQREILGWIL